MAQYGYGGRSNPYDQRGPAPSGGYNASQQSYNPPHGGGYNSQQYGASQPYGAAQPSYASNTRYNGAQPAMGRDNYGANVEMEPLTSNGSSFGGRQQDPNAILNECKEIDKGIDRIENSLEELKILQQRSLDDPDSSAHSSANRQLDDMSSRAMKSYREFAGRIKAIKQQPDSGSPRNAPQVGKVDRRLKAAIQQYQVVESDYRARLRDQMARQYRIVNPNASQAELTRIVSDTSNQQIFSQALMQSDRRGQSRAALSAVEDRHAAIQKIESQMLELAELFNEMETLVVQQEAAVTVIEQKGEEVVENIQGGNEHLVKGVQSARSRRRKKWWCLLICVIILIIVGVAVGLYFKLNNPPKRKRSLEDALQIRDVLVGNLAWMPRGRSLLPSTPSVHAALG